MAWYDYCSAYTHALKGVENLGPKTIYIENRQHTVSFIANDLKFGKIIQIELTNIFWKFDINLKLWRHYVTPQSHMTKFHDFSINIADLHQKLCKQVRTVISYHPWKFQLNRSNTSKVMGGKHTLFSLFGILIYFNPIF